MGTSVACNGLYVMSYMGLAKTFSTGAPTFDLGGGLDSIKRVAVNCVPF